LSKNKTQCLQPGLEPEPLDPETSALTMSPPRFPYEEFEKRRFVYGQGQLLLSLIVVGFTRSQKSTCSHTNVHYNVVVVYCLLRSTKENEY